MNWLAEFIGLFMFCTIVCSSVWAYDHLRAKWLAYRERQHIKHLRKEGK